MVTRPELRTSDAEQGLGIRKEFTYVSGLKMDSRELREQERQQRSQERFAPSSDVVDTGKEAQVWRPGGR